MNARSLVKMKSIQKKHNYACEFIMGWYIHYSHYTYIAKGSTWSKQWPRKKWQLDNEPDNEDLSEGSDEDDKEMDTFFKDIVRLWQMKEVAQG